MSIYRPQSIFQIKERKKMEKQFKQAQKPWQKYLAKWGKTEAEYQVAVTNEKTAIDQEEKASNDMSISKVQVRIKLHFFISLTRNPCPISTFDKVDCS